MRVWLLKPVSDSYRKALTGAYAINPCGLLKAWNPLSDTGYGANSDITGRLAAGLGAQSVEN